MAETKIQLADWLDDLCVRFILNLPQEELASVERICFQVEEAQWFYEDFIRPLDPSLPSLPLRQFCLVMFQHCPMFSGFEESQHLAAYSQFLLYKTRVPVRGVIMLNEAMDQVVLVKGFKKGANWSFPRGKINKDEKDLDCAAREAYEETGFDLKAAGLVREESNMKYIEVSMREQHMKLYVFRGVPIQTHFAPQTRKEISKIQWYKLTSLPGYQKKKTKKPIHDEDGVLNANKLYMVAPFLMPLKKWIGQQRREGARKGVTAPYDPYTSATEGQFTDADAYGDDETYAGMYGGYETDTMQRQQDGLPLHHAQPPMGAFDSIPETTNDLKRQCKLSEPDDGLVNPRQPNNAPISHTQGLLSIFRGEGPPNNSLPGLGAAPPGPPQTPMDQMDVPPSEPKSPRHHPSRPPPFSAMAPPPRFPYPQQQPGQFTNQQAMLAQTPISTANNQGTFSRGPQDRAVAPTGFGRPAQIASMQNQPQHAPYQRTGDPQFAQHSENHQNGFPSIPAASQLPAPKLSKHAMNLLNTFKSTDKAPKINTAVANGQTMAHARSQNPSRRSTPRAQPSPDLSNQASTRRGSLARFGGLIPSVLSPTIREQKSPTPGETKESKSSTPKDTKPAPNNHQANLLNLFKTSTPAKTEIKAQQTPATDETVVQKMPVTDEIVAQKTAAQKAPAEKPVKSPPPPAKVPSAKKGRTSEEKPKKVETDKAPPVAPKILQRPKESPKASPKVSPRPSASKLAQAEIPDRPNGPTPSQRRRKKPVATPKVSAEVKPSPIKILKRPANENLTAPKLEEKPQASQKEPEVNGNAKKPFQPQILRRPQTPKTESQKGPVKEPSPGEDSTAKEPAEKQEYPLWYAIHNPSMLEETPAPGENVRGGSAGKAKEQREQEVSSPSEAKTPLSSANKDFLHSYLRGVVGPKS